MFLDGRNAVGWHVREGCRLDSIHPANMFFAACGRLDRVLWEVKRIQHDEEYMQESKTDDCDLSLDEVFNSGRA